MWRSCQLHYEENHINAAEVFDPSADKTRVSLHIDWNYFDEEQRICRFPNKRP